MRGHTAPSLRGHTARVIARAHCPLSLRGHTARVIARARSARSNLKTMKKQGYVYLMTNKINTVIYTGVTSDLVKRVYQHKKKMVEGFTKKYNIEKLVYYEVFDDMESAITREKQIKAGSRQKKMDLIKRMNSGFKDLYDEIASG